MSSTKEWVPKVGESVQFRWGLYPLRGTITEDRGDIGVGGRRLWRVEAKVDRHNHISVELPTEDLKPLVRRAITVKRIAPRVKILSRDLQRPKA